MAFTQLLCDITAGTEIAAAVQQVKTAVGEHGLYALINNANLDSPVYDLRIRQAMAYATDQDLRNQSRTGGVFEIANGPFPPGSDGFLEETGYPTFDLEGAKALVEEYEAEVGPATISYKTVTDPFALQTAELIFGKRLPFHINATVREQLMNSCDVGRTPDELSRDYPHLDFSHLEDCWWHDVAWLI